MLEQEESQCEKCNGTGEMDSGGTQPWGDQIMVKCDCQLSTNHQTDNDDWIEWGGGDCPVADDAVIEIKLRNGELINHLSDTKILIWVDRGMGTDIIAYRVVKP